MKRIAFIFVMLTAASVQSAVAAQSAWVPHQKFNQYLSSNLNGGKVIPTGIDCRARNSKLELRLSYKELGSVPKPFHKWQWIVALEDKLDAAVKALKRSDRLELKYHVVFQDEVQGYDGVWICAIAFR